MTRLSILALLLLVSACASTGPAGPDSDPFEARDVLRPINEFIFASNQTTDRYVIKPISDAYHQTPQTLRDGVNNFLSNLGEPANVVNGVLQLDPQLALTALWRFALNTTVGMAGLRDFAAESGLQNRDTTFGKTLARYDVAEGSYIVLPLLGPSTVRDTTGFVVDWFIDPVGWVLNKPESIAQTASGIVAAREDNDGIINELYYEAFDPYVATRAAFLQHQAFQ